MKAWMEGKALAAPSKGGGGARDRVDPYAFHMCWTQNKVDKLKYLQQMGGWFLQPQCDEASIRSLVKKGGDSTSGQEPTDLAAACCSEEPVVTCHFRDKASKHPCKDSPPKDKGRPSFW